MIDLLADPRPDLPDTRIWRRLLLIILDSEHKERSILLQKYFWTIRSAGTVIQWNTNGVKLVPIIDGSFIGWPDKEFFDEITSQYLKPHAAVIRQLLEKAYTEATG
ncbi:hypothetical protein [Paenibacillus sp. SI8]|uniref:hypothetical protein n=1 Tax=unclassified Paenibacillus TaxID=185978 RepID=UPI0034676B69